MSGLQDLQKTLDQLKVDCDNVAYGFATTKTPAIFSFDNVLATFVEDEGTTAIASVDYLTEVGLTFEGPFAKLTVEVHTSLELVGLTAALSTQLTTDGISANVIAAFYHDHLFVQYEQKDKAMHSISKLKQR